MNSASSLMFILTVLNIVLDCYSEKTIEKCGIQKIKPLNRQDREPKAYPGQFPWQVAIYHRNAQNQTEFVCGGSLISRRFVLTADRVCTRRENGDEIESDEFTVHMGLHDLETINWATFQPHSVEDILRVTGDRWAGMRNDIALLKLAARVQYSNYVQPVCLGSGAQFTGFSGVVAGWGISDGQDLRFLKSSTMTILGKEDCLKDSGMICASGRNGAKICRNDIGGGLVVKENVDGYGDFWILVGIATFLKGDLNNNVCLDKGSFSDVKSYLPWIGEVAEMDYVERLGKNRCGQKPTGSQQWPWHGSLHRRDQNHPGESTYWCGVTILSKQFVLTVNLISVGNLALNQFFLRFGQSKEFSQTREIEKVFPHSKKSLDLTLIKMKTPLTFTPEVNSICPWQFDYPLEKIANRIGYLAGRGSERFDQSTRTLKEIPMPIASASDCTANHDRFKRLYVPSRTFCAGFRNGTGPDYGDTGGGLYLQEGGETWFLKGVLSKMVPASGYERALKTRYALFIDVTTHSRWIDGVLTANSD